MRGVSRLYFGEISCILDNCQSVSSLPDSMDIQTGIFIFPAVSVSGDLYLPWQFRVAFGCLIFSKTSDYINNFIHIVFNGSGTSCVHNSSGPIKHLLKDILEGKCLHRLTFFKQTIKFSVPSIIPSDTVKGRKFLLDLQIQNGTLL